MMIKNIGSTLLALTTITIFSFGAIEFLSDSSISEVPVDRSGYVTRVDILTGNGTLPF